MKYEVWTKNYELWTVKYELRTVKYELWFVKCEVWTLNCEAWITNYELWNVKSEVINSLPDICLSNLFFLGAIQMPWCCRNPDVASLIMHLNRNGRKHIFGPAGPAKMQIRLRVCAVWSGSSLGAFWIANYAKFLHAANEDSDQIARMRRLILIFVLRIYQKVRFHTFRPIWFVI